MKWKCSSATIRRILKWILLALAFALLLITYFRAEDLISGKTPRREIFRHIASPLVGELNSNFNNLVEYIKKMPANDERLVWFPLNYANYIFIPDKNDDQRMYVGTSLIREYSGHNDFSGFMTLGGDYEKIKKDALSGNLNPFCWAIWNNNINGIITNNIIDSKPLLKRLANPFFSYVHNLDLYNIQKTAEFKQIFFGQKIASFGGDFDLYRINTKLSSNKVEIYEGALFKSDSTSRNWCEDAHIGRLDGVTVKEKNTYHLSYQLKDNESLTISIAEDLGMRYALEIAPDVRLKISSLKSFQIGPKNYYYIEWKENFSGPFQAELISQSWGEKNLSQLLITQIACLAIALLLGLWGIIISLKK